MQQGLQEPQHAGTAAPQCKRAAEDSEPATKLGIVAGAQGAQLHRGWASGCAPHRAADASAKPRPRSEDLHTPRGCAGQQHSLPASCSPVVTDPEHPALAPSTRLALTQPGTQPGMQRPPASTLPYPAPGASPQRTRPNVACPAAPEAQQARMPRLRSTWQTIRQDVSATRSRSLLSRANVPHCLAPSRNTVA